MFLNLSIMALAVTLENGLLPPPPNSAPKDGRLWHVVAQGSSTATNIYTNEYQNEQNQPFISFIDVAFDTYQKLGSVMNHYSPLLYHELSLIKFLTRLTKRFYV